MADFNSSIKPLRDALAYVTFTDRAIGKRFREALERLDEDMDEEEYEPSPPAQEAYDKLAEEIEDAEAQEEEKPEPVVTEVINALSLESVEELNEDDKPLEELKLDDEDELSEE